ncbi:ATP-binding protein [Kitasatospora terrestris]|uniref:ATP-binding protein n=1 Tax=Kitasatospora terrestris TaxID=258051 RepID=A0ABP9EQM5_9ACTN
MNTRRETLDEQAFAPPASAFAPTLPAAGQRRRLPFAGQQQVVTRARAFTLSALTDWSWPGSEDVVLLVAELVANAVLHAGGPIELVLDAHPTRLRIEVSDNSPVLPAPRRPHRPEMPGGHGLYIVQQASDRWGAAPQAWGKTVWAEIDTRSPNT